MAETINNVEQVGHATKLTYDTGQIGYRWPDGRVDVNGSTITITYKATSPKDPPIVHRLGYGNITDKYTSATAEELVDYWFANFFFGDKIPLDTQWSDQHTPAVIAPFTLTHASSTLSAQPSLDDYTIDVVDATGMVAGNIITLFSIPLLRFTYFKCISVNVNEITLDAPVDVEYPIGTFVDAGTDDLAVNGSVTPVIFGLRGTGAPPGVDLSFDMTRIIIQCLAASAVDLSLFGDLAALTNGLLLRTVNGASGHGPQRNILNLKTNGELANICYDWKAYEATNPNQGQDGFVARLTFAGPSKIGVTIRLPVGEDAQFVVQDNLAGLTSLKVIAEGHVVEEF